MAAGGADELEEVRRVAGTKGGVELGKGLDRKTTRLSLLPSKPSNSNNDQK
jgi:hypothetical protein